MRVRTVCANHAITVGVSGLQEYLGLGIGQRACTCLEGLQEQPEDSKHIWWLVQGPQLPLVLDQVPYFMLKSVGDIVGQKMFITGHIFVANVLGKGGCQFEIRVYHFQVREKPRNNVKTVS